MHQNKVARGPSITANGRGSFSYSAMQNELDREICRLEQEAYSALLRAFQAQSDAISWEKEGLMTELRKELRVSDEDHRELLSRVNKDAVICKIREWRQLGVTQSNLNHKIQALHDVVSTPSMSAPYKKQKTSHSIQLMPGDAPSRVMHLAVDVNPKQSFSAGANWGTPSGLKSKKTSFHVASSTGGQFPSRISSGAPPAQPPTGQSLVGTKVMTRWPEDNSFYEAVIRDYNPLLDQHALVYDADTPKESWEWINLKEIAPEDLRWSGDDPGISNQDVLVTSGPGSRKSSGHNDTVLGAGRVRGRFTKSQSGRFTVPLPNGIGKKSSDNIEVANTDNIIEEVERILAKSDIYEIEKAKILLKDHEQSLVDAIARLAEVSDDDHEVQLLDEQSREQINQIIAAPNDNRAHYSDVGGEGDGFQGDRAVAAYNCG